MTEVDEDRSEWWWKSLMYFNVKKVECCLEVHSIQELSRTCGQWLCLICACFLRLFGHKSPGQNGNVGWARLDTSALRIHLVRPPRWFHGPEPTPQGAGWSRLRLTLTSRTFMPLSLHASSAVSKCGKGRRWMRQEPDVHSSKSIFNKLPHRI